MPEFEELKIAAENGDPDAICELVNFYFADEDFDNAEKFARKGAAENDSFCVHILGVIAQRQKNYSEAINCYEKNIMLNDYGLSASNLGFLYMNLEDDPNIETDREKAERLFRFALKQDETNGDAALGLALGLIDSKDEENISEIEELLEKAVEHGDGEISEIAESLLEEIKNPVVNDLYGKLDALVAKAEEFEEIFNALENSTGKFQDKLIENRADEMIQELEKISDSFTDEELEEIRQATEEYPIEKK